MAQKSKAFAAYTEGLSLVPSTYIGQLTTTRTTIPGDLTPSPGFHGLLYTHVVLTNIYTLRHIKEKNRSFKMFALKCL